MGHSHGWEEVKKVYDIFGASFTDRKLTARDIAVDVHEDSAYVEFYWHYSAKQKSDGEGCANGRKGVAAVPEGRRRTMGASARALFRDASNTLVEVARIIQTDRQPEVIHLAVKSAHARLPSRSEPILLDCC
jgi:hypothetical protein